MQVQGYISDLGKTELLETVLRWLNAVVFLFLPAYFCVTIILLAVFPEG